MKFIYPEKQTSTGASASSQNSAYPVANLFDEKPKKPWKAGDGVQTATLRLPIEANACALELVRANAASAVCTITLDSAEKAFRVSPAVDVGGGLVKLPVTDHLMVAGNVVLINGTTNYDGVRTLPSQAAGDAINLIITATYVAETFAVTDTACIIVESTTHTLATATRTYDRLWQEYPSQVAAHTATIEVTTTEATVKAGVFRAGATVNLARVPKDAISDYPIDQSVVEPLSDGSRYVNQGDVLHGYTFQVRATRNTEYFDLWDIVVAYGPRPVAVLILEDDNDLEWAAFVTIENFGGSHDRPADSMVSMTIEEAP